MTYTVKPFTDVHFGLYNAHLEVFVMKCSATLLVNISIHHRIVGGLSLAMYRNALMERHGESIQLLMVKRYLYHGYH